MMGYFVNDVMSPLEALLEMPKAEGGLGWTSSDYGFFSGSGSFINVFLLMLFFSGLILDKMGIRFTGVLACSLMVLGTLLKYYAVTTDFGTSSIGYPVGDGSFRHCCSFEYLGTCCTSLHPLHTIIDGIGFPHHRLVGIPRFLHHGSQAR